MPTYNIIGDIHGRDTWKRLVDDNCINIFVGDYFDPYLDFTIEELERNFMEIVEYKRKHRKNTVLLYGNHDMDYLPGISEHNSRYDEKKRLLDTATVHRIGMAVPRYCIRHRRQLPSHPRRGNQ